MVKDECDIIELFVRINLRFVDRMFIIDNRSTDGTVAIIKRLQEEGCPVTLWHDDNVDFQQGLTTTTAARKIVDEYDPDWIIPLDADEFLTENGQKLLAELEDIPDQQCGILQWRTFVPLSGDYASFENPLWHNFRQRKVETFQLSKVVIPANLAKTSKLTTGNHHLTNSDNQRIPEFTLSTTLAHVPVRSSEQIVAKSIIGNIKHQITWNRHEGDGFHWGIMAQLAKTSNYRFDDLQLQEIAFAYSQKPDREIIREFDAEKRIGSENDRIRYPELSGIHILERFDNFIQELCGALQQNQLQSQIAKSFAYETEKLQETIEIQEKELRFFRKTALGKAVGYLTRKAYRLRQTGKQCRKENAHD